ncbi:MAG: lipid-A-disaccharide synthase [candidate division NC10 bacterium]|nr:lipid-A-disaccharide synthase [candidate division NC10 bacterium]
MKRKVMMVAGEASGDLHGASLARELRSLFPKIEIMGMGGARMAGEGVRLVAHCSPRSSVVGSVEAWGSLRALAHSFSSLYRALKKEHPDLLILVDFPDFNLLLGRLARRRQVPIIYYISPQVWAWRSGRLKTLRRLVDQVLVILPFEEDFYRKAGMKVHFVGHPLLDQVKPTLSREEVRSRLGVEGGKKLIGLLPGSRLGELKRHLPVMLRSATLLSKEDPSLCFAISQAETMEEEAMAAFLSGGEGRWRVWKGRPYDLMNAADLLIVASGTATLEAGLLGTPMVIVYRLSWLSGVLARILIRVEHVGLINLVLGKEVAPELLLEKATPERIAQVVGEFLNDPQRRETIRQELLSVRSRLGEEGASRRAALYILQFLQSLSPS